jgi:hypothetical protein
MKVNLSQKTFLLLFIFSRQVSLYPVDDENTFPADEGYSFPFYDKNSLPADEGFSLPFNDEILAGCSITETLTSGLGSSTCYRADPDNQRTDLGASVQRVGKVSCISNHMILPGNTYVK